MYAPYRQVVSVRDSIGGMFPVTQRSAVFDLSSDDPTRRARALRLIVEAYWKPTYKYIRLRWSKPASEAEDLTQSFFETAIDRDMLASYQPGRARFRTFLRACLDRHVIDHHRKATAAMRGGERMHLEFASAESELVASGSYEEPEAVFEAEWLRHLMQLALTRLGELLTSKGKPIHAALFREVHLGDPVPSYADLAERHGITVTDVTNWLHVARREFRTVALDLLRELTLDEADFAAEARAVFGIDVAES